jgi:hypothetical protein
MFIGSMVFGLVGGFAGKVHANPDAVMIPVMGACCLPDGSCVKTYQPDCIAVGGIWHGPNSDCEKTECPPARCPADTDSDGAVDMEDYYRFIRCFEISDCPDGVSADINQDGLVDDLDIEAMLAAVDAGWCV